MPLFFKRSQPISLGLALGGGAARGFAHVGAIKAFEEHKIKFDYVAGTSAGSIVGALYCAGANSQDLINIAHELDPRSIRSALSLPPIDTARLENILKKYLGDMTFQELKIPFIAVAVDLKEASQVLLQQGSVAKAVSASCAVPFFFRPVIMNNMHLVDGGLLNSVPCDVARVMGADRVVAVDVNSGRGYGTDSLKLLDIIGATIRIMSSVNSMIGKRHTDVLIEPDLRKFKPTSKEGYMEMIEIGYNAAKKSINEILKFL
ncbi:MAG TPA: patatin-like phospholipase family protein [Clostridia bacterium]